MTALPSFRDNRGAERLPVDIDATLREGKGPRLRIRIIDVSLTGCRFETDHCIAVGGAIVIQLPGFGQVEAVTVWTGSGSYGGRFVRPLPDTTFEAIVTLFGSHMR